MPKTVKEVLQRFYFTKHVITRYAERFYFGNSANLEARIQKHFKKIEEEVIETFCQSEEDKSFINNQNLMGYLWEKYGFERKYKVFVSGKVIFVVIDESTKRNAIVTCFAANDGWLR